MLNHWATGEAVVRLLKNVIIPYVIATRERLELTPDYPAIIIYNAFKGHKGD